MLNGVRQGCDADISPESFETISRVIKARFGFTLEGYKDKCVKRRINIRVRSTQCATAEEYTAHLIENPGEQEQLLRVLTINVSHFFRNPPTFEKIASAIIPELLQRGIPELRISSVGCAAGEEPYSLALLLKERFPHCRASLRATDVDAVCLQSARGALYHPDRLVEVPAELKERWFTPEGSCFRLSEVIRAMVDFRNADLNQSLGCEDSDLILCRNVLIYFERGRQEEILNGFADALGSGGYLVLGKSETLFGSARRRFRTVCPVERIYRAI